jgi:hypothetical protein
LETSRFIANYRRTVSGSGSGVLSVRDSVSLNLTREISAKLSLGAGVSAYQTRALENGTTSFDDRDYFQIRGLLSWKLTPALAIDIDYSYTNIDREDFPSDADSNLIRLWFRYSRNR